MNDYIICATPRSGSNLLCELLSSLGFAGKPEEHLWDPAGTEPELLDTRWPRVLRDGTGGNGVFGIKLLWHQAERLEWELPRSLQRAGTPLPQVLEAVLNDPKYIYLTREDRLRQAISLSRATQSNRWRSMDRARRRASYDAEAIARAMRWLEQNEEQWEIFCSRHRLSPYRLRYEELDANPRGSINSLLTYLGSEQRAPAELARPRHRRQADRVTEEWIRRYQGGASKPGA